jgi:hypothetical protein
MKRDWEVIRKILVEVEALPSANSQLRSDGLEGVDREVAGFNMGLLIDAGLVSGVSLDTHSSRLCIARRLTWGGCEFLDAIRRDTMWNKIQETAREKGLDLTIDVVKAAAKSLVSQLF